MIADSRRTLLKTASGLLLAAALPGAAWAADRPKEVRLDYATYSPTSLVLKHSGWAEAAFKAQGIEVRWVLSTGSARALEYLNSGGIDFASTAGLASVLSRANGNPVKAVYVYSRPEWTALVVPKDSPVRTIGDLKGKKIAAAPGTDAYLFLLRALHTQGLTKADIQHVSLPHADGRAALEQRRVDAWGGLDPLMAASQLEAGSRILYRNVDFNTYGFLNTSEAFAQRYPDTVRQVIGLYERARLWLLADPQAAAELLSQEAKVSLPVAKLQLSRNDFSRPVIGAEQAKALKAAAPILSQEKLIKAGVSADGVVDALIDPSFARAVIR
ncbi:MAG: transporter substrate-binding protein [Caulobacteraceae bacterium]|nr:transporter substrate-binding protein [Caulobacteraceae bacterium]